MNGYEKPAGDPPIEDVFGEQYDYGDKEPEKKDDDAEDE